MTTTMTTASSPVTPVTAAIRAADRAHAMSNGFKEFTWREHTIMAQVFLQMLRGSEASLAIELLDPDAELTEVITHSKKIESGLYLCLVNNKLIPD